MTSVVEFLASIAIYPLNHITITARNIRQRFAVSKKLRACNFPCTRGPLKLFRK